MPRRVTTQSAYTAITGNAAVRVSASAAISSASIANRPRSRGSVARTQNIADSSRQNSGSLRMPFAFTHSEGRSATHSTAAAAARRSSSQRTPSR